MNNEYHLANYRRCLWQDAGLLVVAGDFGRALLSRDAYNSRHGIETPGGRGGQALERALAAAGLAALSLAERESWGWSMSFAGEGLGLFCAVEPEGMLCGRLLDAPTDGRLVAVQRQKAGEPIVESRLVPEGGDPARAVERYFEVSVQLPTRIAVSDAGPGALVQLVPGGDFARVAPLDDEVLLSLVDELSAGDALKTLDEVLLFYECRCDDGMVAGMVQSLPEDQRREVWGERATLEVECPRCGRGFLVSRPISTR